MTRCLFRTLSLAAVVSLGASLPAAAQSITVKGGATFSTLAVKPSDFFGDELSADVGFLGGAALTFREASRLIVEVGGQVAMRRVSYSSTIEDKLTYFEAPVVVRYPLLRRGSLKVSALGGGSLGVLLTARETFLTQSGEQDLDVKGTYESFEVAAVVGAVAELTHRWSVEGRYLFGVTEAFAVEIDGLSSSRQRGWQFMVGYRLR
jgi:hypothetical protein